MVRCGCCRGPHLLLLLLLLSVQGCLHCHSPGLLRCHHCCRVLLLLLLLLADQLVHPVLVLLDLLVEEHPASLGRWRLGQELEVVEAGG